jgi:hypothetical protein
MTRVARTGAAIPVAAAMMLSACGGPAATPTATTELLPGMSAPAFTAKDDRGTARSLADFKGKFVVLEWHSNGCPANAKHYDSGNIQTLQKWWTSKGVVWLTVESSSPGTDGYVTAQESQAFTSLKSAAPTAVLLDPDGTIGHAYGAKVTPQVIVVDPKGVVVYNGAVDDKPGTDVADIPKAKNYVNQALNQAIGSQRMKDATSTAYGCSVKYANTAGK